MSAVTAVADGSTAWTARRIVSGHAECLGAGEHDETGYPMRIWV